MASIDSHESYDANYFLETHRNWFNNPNLKLFDKLGSILKNLGPQARIIDVGCGNGALLKYLHDRNPRWRLSGVDICELPEIPGVELARGDAFSVMADRQFDAVISLAVIEHVGDVRAFAQKLRHLCAPNGLLIVATVNDRSLTYSLARQMHHIGLSGPFNRLYSKHHVNHFNFASLQRLLTNSGMKVEQTIGYQSPMAAIDMPATGHVSTVVLKSGLWGLFQLERITGREILQVVVCQNLQPSPAVQVIPAH